MIVDAHAHVLPGQLPPGDHPSHPRMTRCDDGDDRLLQIEDVEFRAEPVWFETDRRLAAMDLAGVDVEVVSPMPPLLNYRLPVEDGAAVARYVNERTAALVDESGGRIQGLGTVPLQEPDRAAAELEDIAALGLRGVEVASHVNGVSIGDPRFLDFFREVERRGQCVFVHAIRPAIGDRLPTSATASFGFTTEASLAAASLVMHGTLAACPELRVSISHGAGGFPMMLPRAQFFATRRWTRHGELEIPEAEDGAPTPIELAKRLYYDSLVFDTRAVQYLVERLGVHCVLLGSDFPAIPRQQPATHPLEDIDASNEHLAVIAGSNALTFLAIEESGF